MGVRRKRGRAKDLGQWRRRARARRDGGGVAVEVRGSVRGKRCPAAAARPVPRGRPAAVANATVAEPLPLTSVQTAPFGRSKALRDNSVWMGKLPHQSPLARSPQL